MKYNPDIHHRKSIRLKDYDYSQTGYYFVTICSYNKENLFGYIENETIQLNDYGKFVEDCIKNIPQHFSNSMVDYYCIMPNHLHLIVIIDDCRDTACRVLTESESYRVLTESESYRVPSEAFGKPVSGSLPTIIHSLKSAITKRINEIRNSPSLPVWQRNYYEHVIRNEKELYEIRKYIENNPINWKDDEYNS